MKFSVGDKVLLRQTGEEGEIIAFIGKTMLEVSVNGVHFPAFIDEVDHPYLRWFTEEKKGLKKKKSEVTILPEKAPPKKLAQSIYLSMMPVYRSNETEDIVEQFRIYLLNETPVPIRFQYSLKSAGGQNIFSHSGELHAFGHIFLHSVSFDEMAEQARFAWELAEAGKKKAPPHNGVLRIRPQKLFEQLQALLESGDPSFSYVLAEDVSINLKPEIKLDIPSTILPARSSNSNLILGAENLSETLDLHAAALIGDHEHLSNTEIIRIQISALEKHIDAATAAGLQRVVVIHGVGSGVLRETVQAILSGDKRIEKLSDEWEGAYGFGATIAYLRQG